MTLKEINDRMIELRSALDVEDADLDAIETEINELTEKRTALENQAEKRSALIEKALTTDVVVEEPQKEERKEIMNFDLSSKEYRSAWAKTLMGQPLTEVEERAVGTALTTTATTYVGADVSNDGVNNAGLFIPTEVMMELMNRIELVSPFFRDIPKTDVRGFVKFPYRKGGSGAGVQTEGTANTDGQVEWSDLTLTVSEISETIRITWKAEAMTVDGFIGYLIDELAFAIPEKIANEVFYGSGSNTLTGIAASGAAIDGAYQIGESSGQVADVYEAIIAGWALLTNKRKRIGAKIYVAQDIMDGMAFARDDENRFIHNPINGVGINSFGKLPVEVDPFLADGDFVIGNPRYYKFNWNEKLSITRDVSGKARINDYTGYALVSGAPEPGSFVYGKKQQ